MPEGIEEKTISSRLCRIYLRIESLLYSLLTLILYAPMVCFIKIVVGAIWVATHIPQIIEWVASTILVPCFTIVWMIIKGISLIVLVFIGALISIVIKLWRVALHLFANINWCATRSLIRILSLITSVGAIIDIIRTGMLYPPSAIFTGRFYDTNPDILMVHVAIGLIMISIVSYYNAWAYSKDEEVAFICKNTWMGKRIFEGIKKLWR